MPTTHEAVKYLRLSRRTLERLRLNGLGPRYIKTTRKVLYAESKLESWLAARLVRSTSEAVGAVR